MDIVGRVFDVENDSGGVAFQMWTDAEASDGNVIVYADSSADVKEDDYVRVQGTVGEAFTGENGFGAELTAPTVKADSVEETDASALDPAIKTYNANQTEFLGGVRITVSKIELAQNQTRIHVRYTNNSGEDFYGSPSLVANGEEVETSYADGLKEPSSSVSPGASSSGVLAFEPVDDPSASLRLSYDGYDADYLNEIHATFT